MKLELNIDSGTVTSMTVDGVAHSVTRAEPTAYKAPDNAIAGHMHVVDVGSQEMIGQGAGGYRGDLDPGTLTRENWRYWQDNEALHAVMGDIFDRPPFIGIPGTGYVYTNGDLANVEPDGTPFIRFLHLIGQ